MENGNPPIKLEDQLELWREKAETTFWGYLGCEFDSVDERQVTVSLEIKPEHLNLIGILHGGVHATLIDSAMGLAVMIARPQESVVTSNLNLHYVAPVRQGRIFVTAEVVYMSRKSIHAQAYVRTEAGDMLAFGTGAFRVIHPA